MAERRPTWWSFAAVAGVAILSSVLTVVLLLAVQRRAAVQDEQARDELRRVQTQQRAALCTFIVQFDDNYRTSSPSTEAGRKNAASVAQLRTELGCPPR